MKVVAIPVSSFMMNCYVYYNEQSLEAFIIDPGSDFDVLKAFIENNNLKIKAILLTHGHADHIGAVDEIRAHTNALVYAHKDEKDFLSDTSKNLSTYLGFGDISLNADFYVNDGDKIHQFSVIHTPGHTPGGVCYLDVENKVIFTGDTLFRETVGRTDLPGSVHTDLVDSIKNKLFVLDDDITIYPGHSSTSTIGHEKVHNKVIGG